MHTWHIECASMTPSSTAPPPLRQDNGHQCLRRCGRMLASAQWLGLGFKGFNPSTLNPNPTPPHPKGEAHMPPSIRHTNILQARCMFCHSFEQQYIRTGNHQACTTAVEDGWRAGLCCPFPIVTHCSLHHTDYLQVVSNDVITTTAVAQVTA
jgi:hypothetical protein